jgi:hypothetical protein
MATDPLDLIVDGCSVSLVGQSEHIRDRRGLFCASKNSEFYGPAAATVFPGGP